MAASLGQALLRRAVLKPQVLVGLRPQILAGSRKAHLHSEHKTFPIPTPENDWKGFQRGWPDDGYALGDYPNLPNISYQRRQPLGWWDQQDRRNFGEPIHEDEDGMNIWIWQEVECNDIYTKYEALVHFLVAFSILGFVAFLSYFYDFRDMDRTIPKEYPFNNLYLERGGDPDLEPCEKNIPEFSKINSNVFGS